MKIMEKKQLRRSWHMSSVTSARRMSAWSMSEEKRLRILPLGVVSKYPIVARIRAEKQMPWSLSEALYLFRFFFSFFFFFRGMRR